MKPLHVMFVTGEYPPMPGGVGAYTQELAKALPAYGVQVSVLTAEAAAMTAEDDNNGVRVLPVVRKWDWSIWPIAAQLAAETRADWLHVQYQTAAYAMHPAINLAPERWRKQGVNVAWTYHDLLPPYLFPKAGHRLRTWITQRPAFKADRVVVTNEGDRSILTAAGVNPTVIPIGSNIRGVQLTPPTRAARRQAFGYDDQTVVLGYFGFLNRSKGGLALIHALYQLARIRQDVRLLMVGEQVGASDATNNHYLDEVQALIYKLGVEQLVQWTGNLPDADVGAALNCCDILVMPFVDGASLRRGTLMAGLANGCAIVTTTPQAPLPELVHERDLLFVPPEDAPMLAGAVLRLINDPALAQRLRANARARSALFGWDAIAQAHLAMYTNSPANSTPAAPAPS